jgi:hypothetical protein
MLLVLPDEILELVVRRARGASLHAVQATCHRLRALRIDYLDLKIGGVRHTLLLDEDPEMHARHATLERHRDNVRAKRPLTSRDGMRLVSLHTDEATNDMHEFLTQMPYENTSKVHGTEPIDAIPLVPKMRYLASAAQSARVKLPYRSVDARRAGVAPRCRMVRDGKVVIDPRDMLDVDWAILAGPQTAEDSSDAWHVACARSVCAVVGTEVCIVLKHDDRRRRVSDRVLLRVHMHLTDDVEEDVLHVAHDVRVAGVRVCRVDR